MKEVKVAKTAGFCFGVSRAVEKVNELADTGSKVYTLGPIIHNEQVVEELCKKGVSVLESVEAAALVTDGYIVIRSHGVDRKTDEILQSIAAASEGRVRLIDATCPFVKKIHRIVNRESEAGKHIIIAGDAKHPEVEGIVGWCLGSVDVVGSAEELEKISFLNKKELCLVAQTTFNYKKFEELVAIIEKKGYSRNTSVVNTICNATEERQTEARKLAMNSDAMIVIGSMHSSNTRKLYEISAGCCNDVYYVQNLKDLESVDFSSFHSIGITAGASTPHNIIEEVHRAMEDMNFGQMLEESFPTKSIHNGEVVEGTVIDVKEDEIVLNIGYKSDGIISRSEYSRDNSLDLTTVVKVDDKMKAKVIKVNDGDGQVLLSYRKVASERVSQMLQEAFDNKTVITGKVTEIVKGGITVLVDDTRVFIPASLVSDTFEKDLTKYQDTDIEFVVIEYNPKKRRVIGDRKQVVAAQKAEKLATALANIKEGDVFEGTVKNITDFGVFVDIGDVDGLLHVSEIGWGRTENPKKTFKVGDTVKVFVKEIKGDKIALSKKFDDENPWADAEAKYAVGTVVTGKVARMTSFGAFIELADGVDALLHVSQISKNRVEKPSDVLSVGQEIEAKIVDFKAEDKKISLSMKVLAQDEEPVAEEPSVESVEESAEETAAESVEEAAEE
ncbi:MAG: bifunctional 4-hydroxy-3-methylbut-2-enyl diphosphate reductase/30S ribosomal protein S1 [Lachnospiraceae bacterium]